MKTVRGLLLILVISVTFSMVSVMAIAPFGANISNEISTRAPADSPASHEAIAGNVTEITVTGFTTTQSWQGYFGNVSGTVQLADSSDNVLYNWSLVSPEGEVYAANHSNVAWTDIQCFNFTATGDAGAGGESGTRGATSLTGQNLTQLEANFTIVSDDVDGVDETFSLSNSHDLFYTNNLEFSAGECLTTFVYNNTGQGGDNNFEEVLLWDPDNDIVVFTSILDEEDVSGFDGEAHDFEMLVLEDGHGTDVVTTTYYFYIEIE